MILIKIAVFLNLVSFFEKGPGWEYSSVNRVLDLPKCGPGFNLQHYIGTVACVHNLSMEKMESGSAVAAAA